MPAVALMFKYLTTMFETLMAAMKDAIKNKQKSSFKKFMIYASKFNIISEILFSAFYAKDDDLLYKDITDEIWDKFFEVYDYYEPNDLK